MEETQDQVQQDSQQNQGPELISRIEEDDQASEQSDTTSEEDIDESKVFKVNLPDGEKEMTPDELYEHYQKIGPEFTKRSQRLAELEKEKQKWEQDAKKETSKAIEENAYLRDVDPNVKEAIIRIVEPAIEERLRARDEQVQREAENEAFSRRLEELEGKYPGGGGLPKFDIEEIIAQMRENGEIFDPEVMYKTLNWDAIIDHYSKEAIKGKKSNVKTEDTSGSTPRKPDKSSPKTFEEAGRRALSR